MTEVDAAAISADVKAGASGQSRNRRFFWWLVAGVAVLFVTAAIAVTLGPTGIALREVAHALLGRDGDVVTQQIILDVRLPRVLAALLCGASLALAGVLLQAIFGNVLVDASLIGVAPTAGVGALLVTALFGSHSVIVTSLAAAALTVLALFALTRVRVVGTRFVLAGVACGGLATAILGVLVSIPATAGGRSIAAWVFGSLALADALRVAVLAVTLVLGGVLVSRDVRALDIACLGEGPARRLGVDLPLLRRRWLLAVALFVAPSVAMFGVVGFIGLAVPHLMRLSGLRAHRVLLPASALMGAWLLLLADTAARTAIHATEIPVSFVLALVGAPVLLHITLRGARE